MPDPRVSRRSRRWALIAAAALALTIVATACMPPPPAPPAPLSPMTIGVTHSVASQQFGFVDTSRPTAPYGYYPGSPSRSLPTTVWYPSDGGGPFPLVVFAHGFGVTPANYGALLSRIASAGYVVAAPTYPLLSGQPAGPTEDLDWDQLYADTWFVTTQVLDRSAGGDPVLGGLIDPARIAAMGHSDGAVIAFGDGYQPWRLDWRVRAVVAYAADLGPLGRYQPNGRPMLHLLSDQDEYNPYGQAIAWDRSVLQPPKHTLSLWNAAHGPPYMNPADPHFDLVVRVTIDFLDTYLKAHPESMYFAALDVANHPSLGAFD
jgi:dienelactone hydrolase